VALCTQLADRVHGPLTPQEVLYTRASRPLGPVLPVDHGCDREFVHVRAAAPMVVFANFCVLRDWTLSWPSMPSDGRALPQVPRRGILAAVRVYFANSP